jgi:hypothetical protein
MTVDIKDFYLNTPLACFEYMRLPLTLLPNKIIQQHHLHNIATPNGWVYIKIRKGMYGLK